MFDRKLWVEYLSCVSLSKWTHVGTLWPLTRSYFNNLSPVYVTLVMFPKCSRVFQKYFLKMKFGEHSGTCQNVPQNSIWRTGELLLFPKTFLRNRGTIPTPKILFRNSGTDQVPQMLGRILSWHSLVFMCMQHKNNHNFNRKKFLNILRSTLSLKH